MGDKLYYLYSNDLDWSRVSRYGKSRMDLRSVWKIDILEMLKGSGLLERLGFGRR